VQRSALTRFTLHRIRDTVQVSAVRFLETTSCDYCSALKLTAVRVTSRSTIITAPMITMTRPSGSQRRCPIGFKVSKSDT
jgi:hypothetical protein